VHEIWCFRAAGFGSAVLFKGPVDLGEQVGGVFDWVGRATDDSFVGFTPARTTPARLA
jgi:hypothetical protein